MMHSPSQCSSKEGTVTAPILQAGKEVTGVRNMPEVSKILVYDIGKPVSLTISIHPQILLDVPTHSPLHAIFCHELGS